MGGAFKIACYIFLAVFVIAILGAVAKVLFFPAKVANDMVDTAIGVEEKTLNANNALFNYENFYDMYQGAKQQKKNIADAQSSIETLQTTFGEDVSKWPKDTREEYYFKNQTLDGYKMQYARIVADYNADSKKFNRSLFKAKELPYQLPEDWNNL